MGLETVVETIGRDARAEADEILRAAQSERERVLGDVKASGEKDLSSVEREAREVGERIRTQQLARAQLESKKIVLQAQKEVLEEVKRAALQRLEELPGNEELLKALIGRHKEEIAQGRVFCTDKDATTVKSLLGKAFGGTIPGTGGLVIESSDGAWRTDLRYYTILQGIWEGSMREIAKVLWSE